MLETGTKLSEVIKFKMRGRLYLLKLFSKLKKGLTEFYI